MRRFILERVSHLENIIFIDAINTEELNMIISGAGIRIDRNELNQIFNYLAIDNY